MRRRARAACVGAALAVCAATLPAHAQTVTTWTGGAGTTSWDNTSNWSNGLPSNALGSTTTIDLPNASVTTPANVAIRLLTVSGSLGAGQTAPTLTISKNLDVQYSYMYVGSDSSGSNRQGIVNQTSGTVSVSYSTMNLYIAASATNSTSNNRGEYNLNGSLSSRASLLVAKEIYIGSRPGETGLLSLDGYSTVSSTSNLSMGIYNGTGELRMRGGNLAVNIGGGLTMNPYGAGASTIAATLTDSGSTGFSTITTAGAVQFGKPDGSLNPTSFTLALDGWVSSGVGQVVTILSSGSTFTGAGRFGNVTNGATLVRTSGTAAGSPSYTFTAGYGLDNADNRTKFNLTVSSADLTWNNGSSDGVWSTGTANAGFTGSRWVPGANVTFGATGAGAVTVSGTQSVRNLTVSAAGYSFSGGGLSLGSSGTWSIANDTTVVSALSGSGGLVKIGAGALVLSGLNSYSGATVVNAGRLLVNGSLGSSAVTVNTGGLLGGSGSIAGLVTIAGGTLSPGNSPGTLSLDSLLLSGTSTTLMEIDGLTAGSLYDQIVLTGSLAYGGTLQLKLSQTFAANTGFDLFKGFAAFSGNFASVESIGSAYTGVTFTRLGDVWTSGTVGSQTLEFNQATGSLMIVPEPAGLAIAVVSLGAVGWAARRRKPLTARPSA